MKTIRLYTERVEKTPDGGVFLVCGYQEYTQKQFKNMLKDEQILEVKNVKTNNTARNLQGNK